MAFLLAVRVLSGPYLTHAENINWNWLVEGSSTAGSNNDSNTKKNKGEELVVLVTKWGEEIIGALAMRISKRDRRAYIKAWTVKLRFRGKEIGRGLLEEASKIALAEKGCRGIEFEEEHASEMSSIPYIRREGVLIEMEHFANSVLQITTVSYPSSSMPHSTKRKRGQERRWRTSSRIRRGKSRSIECILSILYWLLHCLEGRELVVDNIPILLVKRTFW